jgi:hypothetical protein
MWADLGVMKRTLYRLVGRGSLGPFEGPREPPSPHARCDPHRPDEKALAISKRLGHFDPKFTLSRYGHLIPDEDEALADRLKGLAPRPVPEATIAALA